MILKTAQNHTGLNRKSKRLREFEGAIIRYNELLMASNNLKLCYVTKKSSPIMIILTKAAKQKRK